MKLSALLLLLCLRGAVWSSSDKDCPQDCFEDRYPRASYFKHVSKLMDNSVAPWNLTEDKDPEREPETILRADCHTCADGQYKAAPIYLEVYVHRNDRQGMLACRCPYQLAVGCTCVR